MGAVVAAVRKRDFERILNEIEQGDRLNTTIYESWGKNLRKGLAQVYHDNTADTANARRFDLNVSRFAAYKAKLATDTIARELAKGDDKARDRATSLLSAFNARQQTEHNTTVTRARTAKDWDEFESEDNKRLFPNLRWLPSLSTHRREEHEAYYDHVWAKDDPFWLTNQPGTLWNCKCRWEETSDAPDGAPHEVEPAKGLRGNPAKTGKIFSDDHTYFEDPDGSKFAEASKLYYPDRSGIQISVCAHAAEIVENIDTGRNLKDNFPNMDVKIRPHQSDQTHGPVKNPEFEIDGLLADAKRIEEYRGVSSAFLKAKHQGCQAVILDLNAHFDISKPLRTDKLAGRILHRKFDFDSGNIKECYVVFGSKAVKITKADMTAGKLNALLEGLKPQ